MEAKDSFQKSKIKWAIEGDENSKFFHGIINKKRSQLTIPGVFDNGLWCTDPGKVKEAFFNHFEARFKKHVAHRLKINIHKSQVLGVGIPRSIVMQSASSIGCGVMHNQFRYLGVMVGDCMSRHQAWDDTVLKLRLHLSNWKVNTLSIDGRLTLLKSVLGASSLYNMSIFKIPKGILKSIEAIRSNFFNGIDSTMVRFGSALFKHCTNLLLFIIRDGNETHFWYDKWIGDKSLQDLFPRLFTLEFDKEVLVADKMKAVVGHSFRRPVRAGSEHQQMVDLNSLLESVSLSQSHDRWFCDLTCDEEFLVKEQYGHVVDTFIPNKRSKADKRFGFVRFINIFNDEREQYSREGGSKHKTYINAPSKDNGFMAKSNSFAQAVKEGSMSGNMECDSIPAFVLDDECLYSKDVTNSLMRRVSDDDEQSVEDVKGGDTVVHEVGNHEEDSDVNEVPETMFDESSGQKKKQSEDPFGIYPLLDKKRKCTENVEKQNGDRDQNNNVEEPLNGRDDYSDNMGTKPVDLDSGCSGRFKKSVAPRTGGFILCLMKEVVKVGQTIGYNMEGCVKDIMNIIESQRASNVHR
nr:RNA-directed DNA polymerase, eukaryota [Tanacetum cinerariifolium]